MMMEGTSFEGIDRGINLLEGGCRDAPVAVEAAKGFMAKQQGSAFAEKA